MSKLVRPIVKYHGGKYFLYEWINSYFPEHKIYVEPFGGAASVLLNKPTSRKEVYNDLDNTMSNLMKVVKEDCDGLLNELRKLEYKKEKYLELRAIYRSKDFFSLSSMERAVITFAARRMSRGGLCGTFSWSQRVSSGGVPAEANAWNTMLDEIPILSKRLSNVSIWNYAACEIISAYDSKDTLFYLDPPYPRETRVFQNAYNKEMTEAEHRELGLILGGIKGKAVISSYPSTLYEELFRGWREETRLIPNHSSHKKKKELKQERLWLNF